MSAKMKSRRAPQAFASDDTKITMRESQSQTDQELANIAPVENQELQATLTPDRLSRGIKWGGLFMASAGGLVFLGVGLCINELVSGLFARQDWIGWTALGLLATASLAALMIAASETWAIFRLRRLGRIRHDAESSIAHGDKPLAGAVADEMKRLYRGRRDLSWLRARLAEHERDIMDATETLSLIERELIAPLDRNARSVIAGTARRVSVVTAVSPVATVDMAVVAVQNLRMLRNIATMYGARPGTLGLLRLARMVITHVVLTGGVALGDDFIQQLIGHRLMAKLSARLGQGLFNGALTARIGLAAVDVCRPLPFIESKPPRLRSLLAEIARQAPQKT